MFKKILKWVGALVLVAVVGISGFVAHTWYMKPISIDLFFGREALKFALESPELLSSLRVLEQFGFDGHNAMLDDASIASGDRTFEKVKTAHATLLSFEDEDLTPAEQQSKQVMLALMNIAIDGERFRFHNYPVNQLFGVQNGFPTFMQSTHQIYRVDDAEAYVSRLNAVSLKFDQVLEGLRLREERGIYPPQFVIDRVLEEMRNFVATPAEESILMTSLIEKMDAAELAEADQRRLAETARTEITGTVYPAYQRLIDYFVALDDKVEGSHGVWALPEGDAFYALALRFFTTTDYTPDQIHETGLAEVVRIQDEILDILEAEGWDVGLGFEHAIGLMAADQRFYYSDTAEGREQILDDYKAIITEIDAGMAVAFDVTPAAEVDVRRIPEFREKTAPGAYYDPPAFDGSRPGVFYANLYDIQATPTYSMRTLAFHEAVPGHHFQIAIAQEQKNLPFFRRLIPFTAYAEGWALYAEQLAWEMGFLPDPYDNIGRLQAELCRAVRLVVDTGIHAKRWSREEAIDFMIRNTGMAESDVTAEIERYFVLPGQATAYKVGMMKILELRDLAERELGAAYDIREFHNVVLTNGSVPLTILEQLVREYIETRKAA
ncbi:MAG: DUF885 domain-containing protein [Pseudomonadota bacterium]